ncbi:hypothetical protein [Hoyosella altamirensis]|uniref:Uncharacterized protein n=1 Tax=Hoyosella altamirensis TaxID=616997 RepID=A0A839RR26_9ACTN|nr:hypothetical protein [Hoyosella altamirensis]MBB3038980.1 hypothetical protein [Hoyosella altamirensis]
MKRLPRRLHWTVHPAHQRGVLLRIGETAYVLTAGEAHALADRLNDVLEGTETP